MTGHVSEIPDALVLFLCLILKVFNSLGRNHD